MYGQHGAALANTFFMKEGSNIIEVSPSSCRDRSHFRNLAAVCNVGYSCVLQDENHSSIDISQVLQLVNTVVEKI